MKALEETEEVEGKGKLIEIKNLYTNFTYLIMQK